MKKTKKPSFIARLRKELEFHGGYGVTVTSESFGSMYLFETEHDIVAMMRRSRRKGIILSVGGNTIRFGYNDAAAAVERVCQEV